MSGAFTVECDMTLSDDEVVTIVHHAAEARSYVQGINQSGGWVVTVPYMDTNAHKLRHLMANSDHCEQFFMWECRGSHLTSTSFYTTYDGEKLIQIRFGDEKATREGRCGCLLDRACREDNLTEYVIIYFQEQIVKILTKVF